MYTGIKGCIFVLVQSFREVTDQESERSLSHSLQDGPRWPFIFLDFLEIEEEINPQTKRARECSNDRCIADMFNCSRSFQVKSALRPKREQTYDVFNGES